MEDDTGTRETLKELRAALAEMRTRKEMADPAVRVHVERYLESAGSELEYVTGLRDRSSFVRLDDGRHRLALHRAARAVRLAEAKLEAAVAEQRGDLRGEARAERRSAEIVLHLDDADEPTSRIEKQSGGSILSGSPSSPTSTAPAEDTSNVVGVHPANPSKRSG